LLISRIVIDMIKKVTQKMYLFVSFAAEEELNQLRNVTRQNV